VGVQFELDANGILHVLARDTRTGKETVVEIKSAVNVDDAAVQQMVEESVEHAFEDLAVRRWIEAKLKADALVAATRKALQDCGGELQPEYSAQVESSLSRVEKLADGEDTAAGGERLKHLQEACADLDEVTKPMAELLMDRAMEALLRKRGVL
jgi:molecular chaperone DnaK